MRAKRNDGFDYDAYLASPEWWQRREAAVAAAGGRCQLCNGTKNLNVHHRTYVRLGRENPSDLTVLCRGCHEKHHNVMPGPGPRSVPKRKPSELARRDRAELQNRIIALMHEIDSPNGITAKQLATHLPEHPSRIGVALADMRKKKYVSKSAKRWKVHVPF
jgi:hypothetical protein